MSRAKSSTYKGCPTCSWHKDQKCGQSIRQPWNTLRKIGKKSRVSRHEIPKDQYNN